MASAMNIFGRVTRIVKSYTNSLLNSAEDPEKMLEQTVIEMQEDLVKMRQHKRAKQQQSAGGVKLPRLA